VIRNDNALFQVNFDSTFDRGVLPHVAHKLINGILKPNLANARLVRRYQVAVWAIF